MINTDNLYKLYDKIIEDGIEISTKEILNCGFKSHDLNEFINQRKIERIKRGRYKFTAIDDLYDYGKKLISNKAFEKTAKCFERCYEIDPEHKGANFQLFAKNIFEGKQKNIYNYFKVFSKTDNPYYKSDSNFYLYLLSLYTDVPEEYQDNIKKFNINNLRVDSNDKRYTDYQTHNLIRISILEGNISQALNHLKALYEKHNSLNFQDSITRALLFQVLDYKKEEKKKILELVKSKEYEKISDILNRKQNKLNKFEVSVLKLVESIMSIQETKEIPIITIHETHNDLKAIKGNNYKLAFYLNTYNNEQNNINNDDNILNLLLKDICQLIQEIENEKKEISIQIEEVDNTNEPQNTKNLFAEIFTHLMKPDLDNAIKTLRVYLSDIKKSKYEFLIVDLIKLSTIDKDTTFAKPMMALTLLNRNNYTFDTASYVQEFFVMLSQNKFKQANIYLDILTKANDLENLNISIQSLEQVLINTKQTTNITVPVEISNKQKTENKNTLPNRTTIKEVTEDVHHEINNNNNNDITADKEFIEEKHKELTENKGIILLKPMNSERSKRIHELVKSYPDMKSFSIGTGNNRQIVLRYYPYIKEKLDPQTLINSGNQAYNIKNFDKCIENYLQILHFGEPKAFVYAKLGLAYMKKWKKDLAIDYLTVATYLAKQENSDLDFTELIASLKGLINEEDKKPIFRMKLEEFQNASENNYGIENLNYIKEFISTVNYSVEKACQELNIPEEQIDIIKLIYARDYYIQGDDAKGNEFLQSVEKSKNKTEKTKALFKEITRNKRFYKHRINSDTKKLSLNIHPK